MASLFALVLLAIAGAVLFGLFAVAWLVLKLVFLPIRLAIRVVKLVVATVAGLLGGIAMLALAPDPRRGGRRRRGGRGDRRRAGAAPPAAAVRAARRADLGLHASACPALRESVDLLIGDDRIDRRSDRPIADHEITR